MYKDNAVYLHGHLRNQMMTALLDGQTTCITVTLIDGIVLARSAFHHSVDYRSVVLFGKADKVPREEKVGVLDALTEHIAPGRLPSLRPYSKKELNATLVLRIPVEEASTKIRSEPPVDAERDYGLDIWAGVLNFDTTIGSIEPCPRLPEKTIIPEHVHDLVKSA